MVDGTTIPGPRTVFHAASCRTAGGCARGSHRCARTSDRQAHAVVRGAPTGRGRQPAHRRPACPVPLGDTSRIGRSRSTLPGLGLAVALLGALGVLGVGAPTAAGTGHCTGFEQPSAEVLVMSAADLATIADCVNGGYANAGLRITMVSSFSIPSGTAITPIGTNDHPFLGVFDGNHYTISGVSVTGGSSDRQGLFGVVGNATTGATIKNLRLASPSVTGRTDVGALVGRLDAGTIQNVRITGATVSGTDDVGALIGLVSAQRAVIVQDVHADAATTATGVHAGGLIGRVSVSGASDLTVTVRRAATSGTTTGGAEVGGVIGTVHLHAARSTLALTDIAARADVARTGSTGNSFGGVIGVIGADEPNTANLTRIYAAGAVFDDGSASGGLIGYRVVSDTVTFGGEPGTLLWGTDSSGVAAASGFPANLLDGRAVVKTAAERKALATYTASPAWPIVTAWASAGTTTAEPWGICASVDGGYPFLRTILGATACQRPSAPTIGTATPTGRTSATVTFTAGAAGDAPITGYEYSLDNGTSWQAPETATATSPLIATGLTPGTTHSIKVRALNPFGESDPTFSAASVTSAACAGANGRVLEEAGTAGDPYLIGSALDLAAIGTGTCPLDAHHRQTADITLPAPVTSGGVESNFTPIGQAFPHFTGSYDGDGHLISNFVHVDSNDPGSGGYSGHDVGLFSYLLNGAEVRRVHLRDARVGGGDHVAPLIGMVEDNGGGGDVVIEDVSATGSATGRRHVGGLIGRIWATAGTSDTHFVGGTADVDVGAADTGGAADAAGGAIGMLDVEDGAVVVVDDVHAAGDVTVTRLGGNALGGLIGYVRLHDRGGVGRSDPLALTDVIASGAVSAPQGGAAGGLIGIVESESSSRPVRIERAAATGDVSAMAEVGGLIGLVQRRLIYRSAPLTADAGDVDIIDSFARGDLAETDAGGSPTFGGLIGSVEEASGSTGGRFGIEQAYATGAVPSGGKGLVGRFTYQTEQGTSGYWDVETTGRTDGGVVIFTSGGRATEQMRAYALYADSVFAWSIVRLWQPASVVETWGICASVNGGYPYLLMEHDAMPCAAPAAPTGLQATAGDGSATVAFTTGAANDSPITGYEASIDGGAWAALSGATGPFTFTGLVNGQSHAIRLRALSAVGAGAASEAVAVTPVAAASPAGTLQRARFTAMAGAKVRVRATVTGPGRIVVTGMRAGATARAQARPLCTARATARKAGTVTLFCTLTRAARAQLRRAPLRLRVRVAYTPTGGATTAMTQALTLPRTTRG